MKLRTPMLLTFDAFGTLFTPRQPVAIQYARAARSHGLSEFIDSDIASSLRLAMETESRKHPNYGKEVGMKAPEWWANVIRATFQPFISKNSNLPEGLVPTLLTTFSTREGYELFPDVVPFFRSLRELKQKLQDPGNASKLTVGILTNSDDRVSSIISSLALSVGPRRYGTDLSKQRHSDGHQNDFDFVAFSYDIGFSKPDSRIFNAAKEMMQKPIGQDLRCIHVGDELEKDCYAALNAGWQGVLVDREGAHRDRAITRLNDLTELTGYLKAWVEEV